jgi:hypothetical protein
MANVDYKNNVGVGGYSLERGDLPARAPSHRKHCNLTHGPVLPMKFAQPVKAAIPHAGPPWSTGERGARVRKVGSFLVANDISNVKSEICSSRTDHLGSAIPAPPLDAIS